MRLDGSRLRILEMLTKPMTVSDIANEIGLSKATVSHHIKALKDMGLVKIDSEVVEGNFIKRYYVSVLSDPEFVKPQEKKILSDFDFSKEGFVRTLLRMLNVIYTDDPMLKKAGFDVGYHVVAKNIGDNVIDDLADFWEKLKLGNVIESSSERFTVEDCYNCSGLPAIGKPYCRLDEGIIEGVMRKKTGKRYSVKEVKCWGTGDEICEFEVRELKKR